MGMGCSRSTSRLDQLPAVLVCRDRCAFLQDALRHSYALADAHLAYMHSLRTIGPALLRFFDCPSPPAADPPSPSTSTSEPDSHIQFDSSSEDDDEDDPVVPDRDLHYPTLDFDSFSNRNTFASTNDHTHDCFLQKYSEIVGSPGWKTPPPPPPPCSWDYLNLFDDSNYEFRSYEDSATVKTVKEKDHVHRGANDARREATGGPQITRSREITNSSNNSGSEKAGEKSTGHKSQSARSVSVSEVMRELEASFQKASESGMEVLKMLDTEMFRYHLKTKTAVNQGYWKMLEGSSSYSQMQMEWLISICRAPEKESLVEGRAIWDWSCPPQNLSSTMRKLCMWEHKLLDEVKAEEKLRILHAKKCKQMQMMGRSGAAADSLQILLRALSSKIKVAFRVIDKISVTINKLTAEELWPQINQLIHRFLGMWQLMIESHQQQHKMVTQVKGLEAAVFGMEVDDHRLQVAVRLEHELQNWILNFSNWIKAQRGCVRALNGWLQLNYYLQYETADHQGEAAVEDSQRPPVLVIIRQWSNAMDRLEEEEEEVVATLKRFYATISGLLDQHMYNPKLQQKQAADRDTERKMKMLKREGQKLSRALAKEGTSAVKSVENGASDTAAGPLSSLEQSFVAMEKLARHWKQAYETFGTCVEQGITSEKESEFVH